MIPGTISRKNVFWGKDGGHEEYDRSHNSNCSRFYFVALLKDPYVSVLEFKTNRTPGKLITLTGIRYLSLLVLPILSPSISLI